jgi:DNA polymerase-4
MDLSTLENRFGRHGVRLYELARGTEESEVTPDMPTQSVSAEDTFQCDVPLEDVEPKIRQLAETVWTSARNDGRIAHTVVLKLKTSEFRVLTGSIHRVLLLLLLATN